MEITDELIQELSLTPKQMAAAKAVYKAIKAAGRLGINFWDNYGTLTAYNSKKLRCPIMDIPYGVKSETYFPCSDYDEGSRVLYYEILKNFSAGNADDQIYAEIL